MWKTWAGSCIYRSATGIRVFQNYFFRWLTFDSPALQTLLNRYFPEKPGLEYIKGLILAAQLQPANCCILGLGGGGALHALNPFLHDFQFTVVENNQEVIDTAQHFFMINQLGNLEIIHKDAQQFVQKSKQRFQHLLVDLFNTNSFPKQCQTPQFFADCKNLLTANGILAVNLANRKQQWPLFQLIRELFLSATIAIPTQNNCNLIILATKSESLNTLLELLKNSNKVKQLNWDPKWGCMARLK